jgi:hypothetical protein
LEDKKQDTKEDENGKSSNKRMTLFHSTQEVEDYTATSSSIC